MTLSDLPWANANIICGKISIHSISCQHYMDWLWPNKNVIQCPKWLVNYAEIQLHAVNAWNKEKDRATLA